MSSTQLETTSSSHDGQGIVASAEVSLPRLYVLRAGYLIVGVGLAVRKWPLFLEPQWPLMEGVVNCMLAAMSILFLLGIRYPLQMLPVLLFESGWKLLWLATVALPLWATGQVDQATRSMTYDILWVVIPLVVVPWRYVFAQYGTKHGDRWRSDRAASR